MNVSAVQFANEDFPRIVERALQNSGLEPDRLELEITESVFMGDPHATNRMFGQLKEIGVRLALDDFGTGHAAIATLRKFSVARIKIDRSFVQNIDTDDELQVITGAIIQLAERLGISPLAEGVETTSEQKKLQELGCTFAQGYLHARPMPLIQLRAWITTHLSQNAAAASVQMPASA